MPETYPIEFPGTGFEPLLLEEGVALSTVLTAVNSPILFGCRSGICGTCLAEIEGVGHQLPEPSDDELEALEIFAPENPRARLCCQLCVPGPLRVRKIEAS